jgi:hypothetical protein
MSGNLEILATGEEISIARDPVECILSIDIPDNLRWRRFSTHKPYDGQDVYIYINMKVEEAVYYDDVLNGTFYHNNRRISNVLFWMPR